MFCDFEVQFLGHSLEVNSFVPRRDFYMYTDGFCTLTVSFDEHMELET